MRQSSKSLKQNNTRTGKIAGLRAPLNRLRQLFRPKKTAAKAKHTRTTGATPTIPAQLEIDLGPSLSAFHSHTEQDIAKLSKQLEALQTELQTKAIPNVKSLWGGEDRRNKLNTDIERSFQNLNNKLNKDASMVLSHNINSLTYALQKLTASEPWRIFSTSSSLRSKTVKKQVHALMTTLRDMRFHLDSQLARRIDTPEKGFMLARQKLDAYLKEDVTPMPKLSKKQKTRLRQEISAVIAAANELERTGKKVNYQAALGVLQQHIGELNQKYFYSLRSREEQMARDVLEGIASQAQYLGEQYESYQALERLQSHVNGDTASIPVDYRTFPYMSAAPTSASTEAKSSPPSSPSNQAAPSTTETPEALTISTSSGPSAYSGHTPVDAKGEANQDAAETKASDTSAAPAPNELLRHTENEGIQAGDFYKAVAKATANVTVTNQVFSRPMQFLHTCLDVTVSDTLPGYKAQLPEGITSAYAALVEPALRPRGATSHTSFTVKADATDRKKAVAVAIAATAHATGMEPMRISGGSVADRIIAMKRAINLNISSISFKDDPHDIHKVSAARRAKYFALVDLAHAIAKTHAHLETEGKVIHSPDNNPHPDMAMVGLYHSLPPSYQALYLQCQGMDTAEIAHRSLFKNAATYSPDSPAPVVGAEKKAEPRSPVETQNQTSTRSWRVERPRRLPLGNGPQRIGQLPTGTASRSSTTARAPHSPPTPPHASGRSAPPPLSVQQGRSTPPMRIPQPLPMNPRLPSGPPPTQQSGDKSPRRSFSPRRPSLAHRPTDGTHPATRPSNPQ